MPTPFRASNDLRLPADAGDAGDVTEVRFDAPLPELVRVGWTWQDLHHLGTQRVLHFPDGSVLLHPDHMGEGLLTKSARLRRLFTFSWTQIGTEESRELLLCIRPAAFSLTPETLEVAETFSGLMALLSRSTLPIHLSIHCHTEDWRTACLPLLPLDDALRGASHLDDHGLRRVAFHNMTFERRAYHHLINYLNFVEQLDLDSILVNEDDWIDFVAELKRFTSMRSLRFLHSHHPARRQGPLGTEERCRPLVDLARDSRLEELTICRQHRDRKLYPILQRHLKLNRIRTWRERGEALAMVYSDDGWIPPLPPALGRASHDADLVFCLVRATADSIARCRPVTVAEERAALAADRRLLEQLMARVMTVDRSLTDDGTSDDDELEGNVHIAAPHSTLNHGALFYSVARDILGDS